METTAVLTPYDLFQISPNASDEVIDAIWRDFARRHHPDRNGGTKESTQKFQTLEHAYSILKNPEKRKLLDSELNKPKNSNSRDNDKFTGSENENTLNVHAQRKVTGRSPSYRENRLAQERRDKGINSKWDAWVLGRDYSGFVVIGEGPVGFAVHDPVARQWYEWVLCGPPCLTQGHHLGRGYSHFYRMGQKLDPTLSTKDFG